MNNLEKYIKSNQKELNNEKPQLGHFYRFEQRLQNGQSPFKKFYYQNRYLMAGAAAIIVLAVLTVGVFRVDKHAFKSFVKRDVQHVGVSPELQEVIAFYTFEVEEQLAEIDKYSSDKNEALRIRKMVNDQINLLDVSALQLKNELELNGEDERVCQALINNHRVRKEFLDDVIQQLKSNKL